MLYSVLKAWEFLEMKVSFFVEQATKKVRSNPRDNVLNILIFNGKRFYQLTMKYTF